MSAPADVAHSSDSPSLNPHDQPHAAPERCVFENGHAFHSKGVTAEMVARILSLSQRQRSTPVTISGGYQQIDLFKHFPSDLRSDLLRQLRQLQPGIPDTFVFHQLKILSGEPGTIEQVTHTDSLERFVAAIVHLTAAPGMLSTEIARTLHPPFDSNKPWKMHWAKEASDFWQYDVVLAAVMFFLTDQQHRAPCNRTSQVRMVLFCVLGPPFVHSRGGRFMDSSSVFEFEYASRVFGPDSDACLRSLQRYYHTHNPLLHYVHMPVQAQKWRIALDPLFAAWLLHRLPLLMRQVGKKSTNVHLSDQDGLYFERAVQQGLAAHDQWVKLHSSILVSRTAFFSPGIAERSKLIRRGKHSDTSKSGIIPIDRRQLGSDLSFKHRRGGFDLNVAAFTAFLARRKYKNVARLSRDCAALHETFTSKRQLLAQARKHRSVSGGNHFNHRLNALQAFYTTA